jgi:hypothetical protein
VRIRVDGSLLLSACQATKCGKASGLPPKMSGQSSASRLDQACEQVTAIRCEEWVTVCSRDANEAQQVSKPPIKTPVVEGPIEVRPDPDLLLRQWCPARAFPPYGEHVWLLFPSAAAGASFRGRVWLALSFLLVRWCPPSRKEPVVIFVYAQVYGRWAQRMAFESFRLNLEWLTSRLRF